MGRGDEGIAPYRNAGRPQRVGATLVVARPAARTSVGVDAHIRPLPRGSRPAGHTFVGVDAHIRPLPRGSRSGTLGIGQNGRP